MYALIHLTDKIRNVIDKGNYASGIFVDFQKPIDITIYTITKLEYHGLEGIPN